MVVGKTPFVVPAYDPAPDTTLEKYVRFFRLIGHAIFEIPAANGSPELHQLIRKVSLSFQKQ
jgi:hypothetical protein